MFLERKTTLMKYKFKTKPYKHQLNALKRSWNKRNFALFCEMGTGKSKILLDNIAVLYDEGKISAALIVAPKRSLQELGRARNTKTFARSC